jgi:peroxiredoxin
MHAYRDQYATLFRDGRDIVLIAISVDSAEALASWARDDQFQFLFASDVGASIGKQYGAFIERPTGSLDNRSLFIIDPDGKIAHVQAPFREIDPTAYTELGEAIERIAPASEPGN